MRTNKSPIFVDLFSGAGGFLRGFIDAGFKDPIQYIQQEKLDTLYKENKCKQCY